MRQNGVRQRVRLDKVTPFDLIIIGLILLLSIGFLLRTGLSRGTSRAVAATIYHDGQFYRKLALDKEGETEILDGKMIVEVRDKKVRVKESECPRKICVRTGWIQYAGETIVCVPFKTLIEIDSAAKPVVDAVVF